MERSRLRVMDISHLTRESYELILSSFHTESLDCKLKKKKEKKKVLEHVNNNNISIKSTLTFKRDMRLQIHLASIFCTV